MMRIEASRKELLEQPIALKRTLNHIEKELENEKLEKMEEGLKCIKRIVLFGCGDSYYASLAMAPAVYKITNLSTYVFQAYELNKYPTISIDKETLLIGFSSSGETEAVLDAIRGGQAKEALTIAFTNSPGSSIEKFADYTFHIQATRIGWPTQASTSAMAGLLLFVGACLSKNYENLKEKLLYTADLMDRTIKMLDIPMKKLAESLVNKNIYFFSGAGPNWGVANFGAAKIKEWSQDYAVPIHLEEFHHFMTLHQGDPLFLILTGEEDFCRGKDTLEESLNWGGETILITCQTSELDEIASSVIYVPKTLSELSPFVTVLPLHLFGLHLVYAKLKANWERPLEGDKKIEQ